MRVRKQSLRRRKRTLPIDCAASVCTRIDGRAALTAFAMSAMGSTEPTSLLECITVTRIVCSVHAFATASVETRPSPSHGTYVTVSRFTFLRASRHCSMAGCSMLDATTCGNGEEVSPAERRLSSSASSAPTMAWLSLAPHAEDDFILLSAISTATLARAGSWQHTAERTRDRWTFSDAENGIAATAASGHTGARLVVKVDAPAMLGCRKRRRTDAGLPCLKWAGDGVDERLQDVPNTALKTCSMLIWRVRRERVARVKRHPAYAYPQ